MRTNSQPASIMRMLWATVPGTSMVSVVVIDCTRMGLSPQGPTCQCALHAMRALVIERVGAVSFVCHREGCDVKITAGKGGCCERNACTFENMPSASSQSPSTAPVLVVGGVTYGDRSRIVRLLTKEDGLVPLWVANATKHKALWHPMALLEMVDPNEARVEGCDGRECVVPLRKWPSKGADVLRSGIFHR